MLVFQKINDFAEEERGSLLIFFALCLTFLLGIVALSFDMGRRASTQTDMQSFADNVALAAAGELDGADDSITRATLAATALISATNERLKAGTAGGNFTLTFNPETDLVFYENLPANDNSTRPNFQVTSLEQSKYRLPPSDENTGGGGGNGNGGGGNGNGGGGRTFANDAKYVGVRLNTVDVGWLFGNVFSTDDLPDEAVGAVAIAGNTAFTCDIAPLMFCMPTRDGVSVQMVPGQSLLLRSGGNASTGNTAAWGGGDFGYLDLERYVSAAGTCADNRDAPTRDACILNELENVAQCVDFRNVDMEPGQRVGLDAEMYNMRFGMFRSAYNNGFEGDPFYAPGPHTVRGIIPSNSNQDICSAQNVAPSPNTMPFPEDNCHETPQCGRWGNFDQDPPDWNRPDYVDHNYGVWDGGTLITGSGTGGRIDPTYFSEVQSTGNTTYFRDQGLPKLYDDLFFNDDGTPVGESGNWPDFDFDSYDDVSTRYEFYQKEIERAANPTSFYEGDRLGGPRDLARQVFIAERTTRVNYGSTTELYPILPNREGDNGLPSCTAANSDPPVPVVSPIGADRRVITIAAIDCIQNPVNGAQTNVPVRYYYEAFLMKPVGDDGSNPPIFDIWMEIIEEIALDGADGTVASGITRENIQLYK